MLTNPVFDVNIVKCFGWTATVRQCRADRWYSTLLYSSDEGMVLSDTVAYGEQREPFHRERTK